MLFPAHPFPLIAAYTHSIVYMYTGSSSTRIDTPGGCLIFGSPFGTEFSEFLSIFPENELKSDDNFQDQETQAVLSPLLQLIKLDLN